MAPNHPEYHGHNHTPDLEVSLDRIADSLEVHNLLLFKIARHLQGGLSEAQEEALRLEALEEARKLREKRLALNAALKAAPHSPTP